MTIHAIGNATVYVADCLESLRTMPDRSVNCCVTSPPYWGLRDYGVDGQLGLEKTPDEYVAKMVEVFREVRRVLRDDGTLWLNLGDSYSANVSNNGGYSDKSTLAGFTSPDTKGRKSNDSGARKKLNHGLKPKDLVGIPWRVAFALQSDGWYLRQDIIWAKPNPMPESVTDRCTKSHEYVFLLTKSAKYFYDADAVKEASACPGDSRHLRKDTRKEVEPLCRDNGSRLRTGNPTGETRNRRSVWHVSTRPYKGAHFATFPPALIEPCIKAGCPAGGVVLDPFGGSGTTGRVASDLGRSSILCELNTDYVELIRQRLTEPAKPVKKKRAKAAC